MLSRNQAHALLTLARPNAELIHTPVDIDGDHRAFGWTVQVEGRQTHKVNGPAARGLIRRGLVEPTGEPNRYRITDLGEEVALELAGARFADLAADVAAAAEGAVTGLAGALAECGHTAAEVAEAFRATAERAGGRLRVAK